MKRRKPTRKPAKKTVVELEKKPRFRISEDLLVAAARPRRRSRKINPFVLANHPPSVFPEGASTMAMDENINESIAWAAHAIGSIFAEGQAFMGYPDLSALAQRAEYRRISETLATEMTRKWIRFQSSGSTDKTEKIKQLVAECERLKVRDNFKVAAEQDGYMGRSHLYLDTGATDDPDELKQPMGDGRNDVSKAKISKGQLERLKVIEAVWCYPTAYNSSDPLSPAWYNPAQWFCMGKIVDSSRLLSFVGRPVPDLFKPAYCFGGLSMSQMAKPYVDNWLRARQSVSDLLHSFATLGLKTNLGALQQDGGNKIIDRAKLYNDLRDNQSVLLMDKDTEDFFVAAVPLGTLDKLQAQAQEHMAAVSGIPLVKLLGITPTGLNASSEGEIRVFYDWIGAQQESFFRPNLDRVIGFVMLSLWGEIDPEITYVFEPLWSLDDKAEAEKEKIEADTDAVYVTAGVLDPLEVRTELASRPDSRYASINVKDVPEAPEEDDEEEPGKDPKDKPAKDASPFSTRTVQLVRHGATSMNNDDVSVDRIRGWKDIPLSPEGRKEAERLGVKMAMDPPDALLSSDLARARETAKTISTMTGVLLADTSKDFRPWNVGELAGEVSQKAIPVLADYALTKPDEKVPGGESFHDFRLRFLSAVLEALDHHDGKVAIVAHHRNERLLAAWVARGCPADGTIDLGEFNKQGDPTGHITDFAIPVRRLRQAVRAIAPKMAKAA